MRKSILMGTTFVVLLFLSAIPQIGWAESISLVPSHSTANELIDEVNNLRATYGYPPYQANQILMEIAQTHAEYLASISTITHVDANGLRPYQRALSAGYPVAGDLSRGGWFSENLVAGVGLTAYDAVQIWMGDDPHKNTMLSGTLKDVGAGVAVVGNTYYYVLDAGLSTGGTPVAYTPPVSLANTPTIIPNTPNADGSIIHIVQKGDTLGSISLVYGVSLKSLLALNNLTIDSTIYPGQKIIVRGVNTPTPTQPTATYTQRPTATLWPTSTATSTETLPPPTPSPSPGLPISAAGGAVIVIAIVALVAAGIITLVSAGRRK